MRVGLDDAGLPEFDRPTARALLVSFSVQLRRATMRKCERSIHETTHFCPVSILPHQAATLRRPSKLVSYLEDTLLKHTRPFGPRILGARRSHPYLANKSAIVDSVSAPALARLYGLVRSVVGARLAYTGHEPMIPTLRLLDQQKERTRIVRFLIEFANTWTKWKCRSL